MSSRYAIYVVPDDNALFQRVSRWLGWDCEAAEALDLPLEDEPANPIDFDIRDVSATPRKYGFHGIIKPPFSLAESVDEAMLFDQAQKLASSIEPIALNGLEIRAIGGFLILVPQAPSADETIEYESYFGGEITSASCGLSCIEEWVMRPTYRCQVETDDHHNLRCKAVVSCVIVDVDSRRVPKAII